MGEKLKGFLKYFRELSVVVIGIAITFTITDLINSRNERNDTQRYLDAVKLELEDNLATLEEEINSYKQTLAFSNYLSNTRRENLSKDSIDKYSNVTGNLYAPVYNTSSFEMLKTSGTIRLIKDDILMTSIMKSYILIDETKNAQEKYVQRKMDELFNAVLVNDEILNINILKPEFKRLYNFYAISVHISFEECAEQIRKTLNLFK